MAVHFPVSGIQNVGEIAMFIRADLESDREGYIDFQFFGERSQFISEIPLHNFHAGGTVAEHENNKLIAAPSRYVMFFSKPFLKMSAVFFKMISPVLWP